ncbi:MAG: exosortase/archaeosortase family protein, partial [Planctomycetota bacterium]|nr:exosortase/archaeosortase family protein [Planctomycetota bacterium]
MQEEGFTLTDLTPTSSFAYTAPGGGGHTAPAGEAEPLYAGLKPETWLKIGTIAALFAAVFWPNLRRLWDKTNPIYGEPNWGHAVCVPIIGLYFLYANRDELLRQPVKTRWEGLLIMLGGILFYGWAIWPGQNDFFKDFGMVVALFGLVLLLTGWSVMKIAWFPIAYLVCMIPWPSLFYSRLASPLQALAASVSVGVLRFTGVDALNTGTKIRMMPFTPQERVLNVAEACAGLRSLMTFITVAAAVAFLSNRPLWQKIIITVSAIPIAIACNVMRVAGQGLLDYYVSHELSEGFAHQFAGIVMLVPAFFLILLVGWVLDQLFIEEVDEAPAVKPIGASVGAPAVAAAALAAPRTTFAPAPAARAAPRPATPKPTAPAASVPPAAPKPAAPKPATPTPAPAPKRELIIEI